MRDGVPYPVRLNIPGAKIVSLAAGGMYASFLLMQASLMLGMVRSFHAIDSRGDIYVWGELNEILRMVPP